MDASAEASVPDTLNNKEENCGSDLEVEEEVQRLIHEEEKQKKK